MVKSVKWTEKEASIIRKHYRDIGGIGCAKLLHRRTATACCHQAKKLKLTSYNGLGTSVLSSFEPMTKVRLTEYWESLPEDDRDITGRVFGDPAYGRSALHKKMLQVTETKDDSSYEIGSFSDRIRVT